jgi:hypothetical protein
MSELYLVLRSRLDGVVDWVYLDGKIVMDARARKGLGREALGARLHIPALAEELDIRIEQAVTEPLSATITEPVPAAAEVALLRTAVVEALGKLDQILELLHARAV